MEDAELQLVTDACRSIFAAEAPIEPPTHSLDWERLLILGRRHRVQAMLWEGLQSVRVLIPAGVSDRLRLDAEEVVRSNLRIAAESARLFQLFQSEGVDLLFLKGLALAALAYPDPYLKMGWDIDLLVSANDISDACGLLRNAGYSPIAPNSASDRELIKWHRTRKESVWASDNGQFHVDLHSRLSDNRRLLPGIGLQSPRQLARLGNGIELPTLGPEELFAYLCVHGSSSAWFRLKWPMDLAAILASKEGSDIQQLYDRSQLLGAGRTAAQALLLVSRLFGVDVPSSLQAHLRDDGWNRWLTAVALKELTKDAEPTERPLGTRMIHLSQLPMMPGLGFALSEACRQLRDAAVSAS